ncbi:MAG: polysaccharide biosynthesis protein [Ruminococcaceae bacterium]|nr:polysaccharide biosynthesis protein [Oscillospiraceae bacterium]
MSDTSKKQSFLHGTMLLALSTAIVKVIGAFYSIPLKQIIGDDSFGYYSTAYEIYTLLLLISTAGLPVAMSRMIAGASSLNHYREMRKIYTVARTMFLTLGLIGALLMTLFCRQLAAVQQHPDAWAAIGVLGPCCFLICLMSAYRGFFQGQGNMKPTSVSQVLEAVCKLVVGLGVAVLLVGITTSGAYPAAGAIFGVTASCLISALYLHFCFRKAFRDMPQSCEEVSSTKDIAKGLLSVAIPITIGAAGLQLLTVLEIGVYMGKLRENFTAMLSTDEFERLFAVFGDKDAKDAVQSIMDTQKGIYNFTQKIFNMPCAFITPITISIIPAITSQLTVSNHKGAKITSESAARISALVSMPCGFGLALLAEPITRLLGGYTGEKLVLASQLMSVLGVCIIFNALVLLTTAIMQAYGHEKLPVMNMFVGGIVKLAAVFILTGNPIIGIVGTPIGSLLCYACITVLNLFTMRRVLKNPPAIVRNSFRAFFAAALMGGVAYGAYLGLQTVLGSGMSKLIGCAVPIAIGAVIYLFAAIKLKTITREDCLLLPKGEKIANLLHL